jgi:hypothetical protein
MAIPESSALTVMCRRNMKLTAKFRTGIILLIVSQLLGWVALVFVCSLAFRTGKPITSFFGVGLYTVSWGGLGLGVMLAGTEGILYVRNFLKKRMSSLLQLKGPHQGNNP